jgi:general nucleoside transport system ATP-binding protein
MRALSLQTLELTKRFGSFTALDAVSIKVQAGTVHALLGENGAGKSTLVKCLVGFHPADEGAIVVNERETSIHSPQTARSAGIGMVYQHFTLVPSMTVAENLALGKGRLPVVIAWQRELEAMQAFMQGMPFQLDLQAPVANLSAGEKQKTEILKQLYANNRFLILDEPTSVLTPQEADEVLGAVRTLAHAGEITVLLITHKFREVQAYADDVSVLRQGHYMGGGAVAQFPPERLASLMVGSEQISAQQGASKAKRVSTPSFEPLLVIHQLSALDETGHLALQSLSLQVSAGEILGIAGIAGNGQKQLVQAISGQISRAGGSVKVRGTEFRGTRADYQHSKLAVLPEEPLHNGAVAHLSVAQNLALRHFDQTPQSRWGWLQPHILRSNALASIEAYRVKTQGPDAPIHTLSGGNVQRCILARELSADAQVLIVMNPVFGLDFSAVADIHARLLQARANGCAIVLISEDLDELLELSDRVAVMHAGRIIFESQAPEQDRQAIGLAMGGQQHAQAMRAMEAA